MSSDASSVFSYTKEVPLAAVLHYAVTKGLCMSLPAWPVWRCEALAISWLVAPDIHVYIFSPWQSWDPVPSPTTLPPRQLQQGGCSQLGIHCWPTEVEVDLIKFCIGSRMWRRQQTQTPRWNPRTRIDLICIVEGSIFTALIHSTTLSAQKARLYKASLSKIIHNSKSSAVYPSPFPVYIKSDIHLVWHSCSESWIWEVCIISLPFKLWGVSQTWDLALATLPLMSEFDQLHRCTFPTLVIQYTAMDISFSGISTKT